MTNREYYEILDEEQAKLFLPLMNDVRAVVVQRALRKMHEWALEELRELAYEDHVRSQEEE